VLCTAPIHRLCALARLASMSDHYREPGWFTRNVFNQFVAFLTRQGISVLGSRVLAVKGRTSGQWRTTPVNLLTYDGRRYLVAPRGETQWVRNLRANCGWAGTLSSSGAVSSLTMRRCRCCAPT
jgi:F420H(2)-dependent quinone reductase